MNDGLYNRAVSLPAEAVRPFARRFELKYSRHAQLAAVSDRYGLIHPPMALEVKPEQVVEVEVVGGRSAKAVVRVAYSAGADLVLVILPDGFVKTLWLNAKSDNHKSLNRAVLARN